MPVIMTIVVMEMVDLMLDSGTEGRKSGGA
jgi:hypothetical protein